VRELMAHAFVHLVLHGAIGLDPTAKLILLILAEAANKDDGGVAWLGVETLAHRAGITRRQVQRNLRLLQAGRWIEPLGRTGGGRRTDGRGYATRYRINLARLRKNTAKGGVDDAVKGGVDDALSRAKTSPQRATFATSKGDICDIKGDVEGRSRVTSATPEPEVEPELNSTGSKATGRRAEANGGANARDNADAHVVNPRFEERLNGKTAGQARRQTEPATKGERRSAGKRQFKVGEIMRNETEAEYAIRLQAERDRQRKALAEYEAKRAAKAPPPSAPEPAPAPPAPGAPPR
jgi:hypothetical protein